MAILDMDTGRDNLEITTWDFEAKETSGRKGIDHCRCGNGCLKANERRAL